MRKYAVIVAGGSGTRLRSGLPKQFISICGRPMLWWSLKAFADEDPATEIVVVLHPDFFSLWNRLNDELPEKERIGHRVVAGGASRTESVRNGLQPVPSAEDALVAIHDAARPMVTPDLIRRGWQAAQESGAAVPVVAVTDSLRQLVPGGTVVADRSQFVAVQTPQVFRAEALKDAYRSNPRGVFSDDAGAFESAGGKVSVFEGDHHNMKVTNPGDVDIASLLLGGCGDGVSSPDGNAGK